MMLVLAGYLVITALAAVSNGIELDDDGILTDIAKRQVSSATIPKFNDKPVAVNVSMFLQTIFLQFADRVPTLELIFYLRQVWIDPRLAFFNCTSNPKRSVPFSAKNFEVWHPDSFFANDHEARPIIEGNVDDFQKLYTDGTVFWSVKLRKSFTCLMQWAKYPFDTQACYFALESYGYSAKDIVYGLLGSRPITFDDSFGGSVIDPEYKLEAIMPSVDYVTLSVGNFSRINAVLSFIRVKNYFWELFFAPVLFVLMSWPSVTMTGWLKRGPYMISALLVLYMLFGALIFQSFPVARDSIVMTYFTMIAVQLSLQLVALIIIRYLADRFSLNTDGKATVKPMESETDDHQITFNEQQLFANDIEPPVPSSSARVQVGTIVAFIGFFILWQIVFWACVPGVAN